ncbi:class D sortase [Salipaludibacillus sp. HK11]|uniref:class D sortase n=1 Tax=Salipaludibacillus sp. HK11 TaxID=3394320 RepID=UPI0039FD8B6A
MQEKIATKKRLFFLFFSLIMIVGGLWFSTTNAYTFFKGYLIYKTYEASDYEQEEKTFSLIEKKDASQRVLPTRSEEQLYSEIPEIGDLIGELYIPTLDATLPIYHGTDEDELDKGVGHFSGSVLPGENDNSVLAGHRDTVFRRLGEVGINDLLIVTTSAGEFTYKVKKVRIVDEDDRTVIVPRPRATLTVSTCYPFTFVGSAPERYVLVAELRENEQESNRTIKSKEVRKHP